MKMFSRHLACVAGALTALGLAPLQADTIPVQTRDIISPSGGSILLKVGFSRYNDEEDIPIYEDNLELGALTVENGEAVYKLDLKEFFGLYEEPGPTVTFHFDTNLNGEGGEHQVEVQLEAAQIEEGELEPLYNNLVTAFLTNVQWGAYNDTIIDWAFVGDENPGFEGIIGGNYTIDITDNYILSPTLGKALSLNNAGSGSTDLASGRLTTNPLVGVEDQPRVTGWAFSTADNRSGQSNARSFGHIIDTGADMQPLETIDGSAEGSPFEIGGINIPFPSIPLRDYSFDEDPLPEVGKGNFAAVTQITFDKTSADDLTFELNWNEDDGPDERSFTSRIEDGMLILTEVKDRINYQYGVGDIFIPVRVRYGDLTYDILLNFDTLGGDIHRYFSSNEGLLQQGEDVGWLGSAWFGWMDTLVNGRIFVLENPRVNWEEPYPWVNHLEHGALYLFGDSAIEGGMWYYDMNLQQHIYTTSTYYPWIYSYERGEWLYFFKGTQTPGRWFYSSSEGTYLRESEIEL